MNLSEHITLNEFIRTAHRGVDNSMTNPIHIENAKHICSLADVIRDYYNADINVSSGYRSHALNEAVGGAENSNHCTGSALDFTIKGKSNKQVFNDIFSGKIKLKGVPIKNMLDELIYEFGETGWVHIAWRVTPRKNVWNAITENHKTVYQAVKKVLV